MKYSDLTIQKLRDLPIFDVCSKLGITLSGMGKLTKRAKCWYHNDTHPSMHINKKKNIYKCFVCGKGGDVIRLVQDYENLTFSEACAWLIKEFNVTPDTPCHAAPTTPCHAEHTPSTTPCHLDQRGEISSPTSTTPCHLDQRGEISSPTSTTSTTFHPLPQSYVTQSLSTQSPFCQALVKTGYLTDQQMRHAAEHYHLGISKDGGVVFWEIDDSGTVYNGKIMYYQANCHRDKSHTPTWVSAKLKQSGLLPPTTNNPHCLFGLHLLSNHPPRPLCHSDVPPFCHSDVPPFCHSERSRGISSPIAIVESEKSAIILSELFPDYIWLACGGKTMLHASLFAPLGDKRIILFPDTDETGETFSQWQTIAQEAARLYKSRIHVSKLLELHATSTQKAAKIDIVDFLYPTL